jgi:hypothetical protein
MIYFDFEFRNMYRREDIVCVSLLNTQSKTGSFVVDLRDDLGRDAFHKYYLSNLSETWCCFNGLADITCLLTLGIYIESLRFIDAMTESRIINLSCLRYLSMQGSLLATLRVFSLLTEERYQLEFEHKDNSRNLFQ